MGSSSIVGAGALRRGACALGGPVDGGFFTGGGDCGLSDWTVALRGALVGGFLGVGVGGLVLTGSVDELVPWCMWAGRSGSGAMGVAGVCE